MTIFLIDYENVRESGFAGLAELKDEYIVHLFYSDNANRISLDALRGLRTVFGVHKVLTGKQSLDKQLVSYLGYTIAKYGPEASYVIVSKDNGFLNTSAFWREELGITVKVAPDMTGNNERSEKTPKAAEPAAKPARGRAAAKTVKEQPKEEKPAAEPAEAEKPAEPVEEAQPAEGSGRSRRTGRNRRGGRGRDRRNGNTTQSTENNVTAEAPATAAEAPVQEQVEAPSEAAEPVQEEPVAEPAAEAAPVEEPAAEPEAATVEETVPATETEAAEEPVKNAENERIAAKKKQLEIKLAEILVEKQFEREPGMKIIHSVMTHCTDKNVKQLVYRDMIKGFGQKRGLEYYGMLKPLLKQIY